MTYVKGLSSLYCAQNKSIGGEGQTLDRSTFMTDSERAQVLTTLKDFSSVAKSGTLNNLFLLTFAELVEKKQN
jgi:hypothetical protein